MAFLAWASVKIAAIGGAVYLVINGHPWFALLCLLLSSSSIEVKTRDGDECITGAE